MSKLRILVVDDETSFTRLLRLNLEATGKYEVKDENWAPRAVATARDFKPDMIFLDVMMPGMDGGELAGRLREMPSLRGVPIVFLTAAVKAEEIEQHKGIIGGDLYLAKPVDLDVIEKCIKEQVGRGQGTGTA